MLTLSLPSSKLTLKTGANPSPLCQTRTALVQTLTLRSRPKPSALRQNPNTTSSSNQANPTLVKDEQVQVDFSLQKQIQINAVRATTTQFFCHFTSDLKMKIIQTHAGPLTNFEVLDFLRSKNATADPMGCLGSAAPSECKVFEYLVQSAACNQSRDIIKEVMEKTSKFDISKAERLNIINLRPSTAPELYPIIEMVDNRMDEAQLEEIVAILAELLPSPQSTESDKDNKMNEMEAD